MKHTKTLKKLVRICKHKLDSKNYLVGCCEHRFTGCCMWSRTTSRVDRSKWYHHVAWIWPKEVSEQCCVWMAYYGTFKQSKNSVKLVFLNKRTVHSSLFHFPNITTLILIIWRRVCSIYSQRFCSLYDTSYRMAQKATARWKINRIKLY